MLNYQVSEGKILSFNVDPEVFSPSNIDIGTLAMLSCVNFSENDKVLDLGCGYGFVGIYASEFVPEKNVTMVDISAPAVNISKANASLNGKEGLEILLSDGLDQVTGENYTWILSNPPYHADFSVPKKFIHQSYEKLALNGKLVMVTKRKEWYKNRLIAVFGGVSIAEKDGYYIFTAQKRGKVVKQPNVKKGGLSKKLARKMENKKPRNQKR